MIVGVTTEPGLGKFLLLGLGGTEAEALDLVTTRAARILGLRSRGTLVPGAHADLVIVEGAGGWYAPVSGTLSMADLPRRLWRIAYPPCAGYRRGDAR